MGLFDKLFKKQVKEEKGRPSEKVEVGIDNLLGWLKESHSRQINEINSQLSELWAELLEQISGLQSAIKGLEKAKFEPTDKTYAAINMTKDLFTRKSQLLNKIPKSIGTAYSEILSSQKTAVEILNEVKDAKVKQAYVISNYFKKEAGKIVETLKRIDTLLNSLDRKIGGDCLILKTMENIQNQLKERESLFARLNENEKSKLEISMELNKHNASLEAAKRDLEKIFSDKRWEEFYKTKEELEKTSSDLGKIKSEILEDISSIRRPIKKILHESEDAILTKEQRSLFLEEGHTENMDSLYSAIQSLSSIQSLQNLPLKESELEKITCIRNKIESGKLEESRKTYKALAEKKSALESRHMDLKKMEDMKKEKESQIKSIEEDIRKSRAELENNGQENKAILESIEKARTSLQDTLSKALNREVIITE